MKNVDIEAAVADAVKLPVKKMTRAERLTHWANIVREQKGNLVLYHLLEKWNLQMLKDVIVHSHDGSAFSLAAADPVLREQGLSATPTMHEVMGFFEVSQSELHEFSCDCGGSISNSQQADRIAKLAGTGGGGAIMSRVVNGITRMIR